MTKKKKLIMKVCIGIVVFVIGLCILDSLTTYKSSTSPTFIAEENGIIEVEISIGTSLGLVHHYEINEMEDGIYEFQVYESVTNGDYSGTKYKIDNRDGHIKELRSVTGDVIYKKGE